MREAPALADVSATEARWVTRLEKAREQMLGEMHKVIVGQDEVLEQLVYAILCRGHCLLEGVPGLAKTLHGPDPGRDAGPDVPPHPVHARPDAVRHHRHGHHPGRPADRPPRSSSSCQGPIFTNLLLADEINRTPPKTQAALLEAMQERRTTCRGRTYDLPKPFFVLATQNPIEQEGTYPLPEAQLDRFMFMVKIGYP